MSTLSLTSYTMEFFQLRCLNRSVLVGMVKRSLMREISKINDIKTHDYEDKNFIVTLTND